MTFARTPLKSTKCNYCNETSYLFYERDVCNNCRNLSKIYDSWDHDLRLINLCEGHKIMLEVEKFISNKKKYEDKIKDLVHSLDNKEFVGFLNEEIDKANKKHDHELSLINEAIVPPNDDDIY